jgi:hypothetical protein
MREEAARWIWVVIGLAVLWGALEGAAEPYRQTLEFRRVATCDGTVGGCLDREPGSIADRRTYTSTSTDSNGGSSTTTTHYEVVWRRSDGSAETPQPSTGHAECGHMTWSKRPVRCRGERRSPAGGFDPAECAAWGRAPAATPSGRTRTPQHPAPSARSEAVCSAPKRDAGGCPSGQPVGKRSPYRRA